MAMLLRNGRIPAYQRTPTLVRHPVDRQQRGCSATAAGEPHASPAASFTVTDLEEEVARLRDLGVRPPMLVG